MATKRKLNVGISLTKVWRRKAYIGLLLIFLFVWQALQKSSNIKNSVVFAKSFAGSESPPNPVGMYANVHGSSTCEAVVDIKAL